MTQAKPCGLVLAVDTAMCGCAVGLYDPQGRELLASMQEPMISGQAERLIPMIEKTLHESGHDYPDLAAVAVTRGPGAFTGLRIGLAAARGLALALEIPAVGVETFSALVKSMEKETRAHETLAVLIETKRADYYAKIYDGAGQVIGAGACRTLEALLQELQNRPNLHIAGDAVERFVDEAARAGVTADWSLKKIVMCDPGAVAVCALEKLLENMSLENIDADPLYLRAPDVTVPKTVI